jgi:hypothetical protein
MATSSSLRTLLRILVLTYSKSVLGDWRASLSIWSKDIHTKRWPRRVGGGSRLRKSGLSMTVSLVRRQEPRWLASHGAMITWPNIWNTGWRERLLPRRRTAVASSDLRSDSGTALVWSISACLVPHRRCRPALHETQPASLRGADRRRGNPVVAQSRASRLLRRFASRNAGWARRSHGSDHGSVSS